MRVVTVTATIVFCCSASDVLAQSPQAPPGERRFEVASVKPALSLSGLSRFGIQTQPGGRFISGTRLKHLIAEAFEVKDYQIDGGPPWLATDYFEITANAGADATPADVKAMLRTLLAERFGLRTRNETRQAPVYVLTVARSDGRLGPRMTRTTPECIQQIEQRRNGTAPPEAPQIAAEREREQRKRIISRDFVTTPRCDSFDVGQQLVNGASRLLFGGAELTSLVSLISSELSAPVVDRTGLSGLFDIALEYLPERQLPGRPTGLDPNGTDVPPPTLGAALDRQLGLKLEKRIGPLPVVVIEAAQHPTPD